MQEKCEKNEKKSIFLCRCEKCHYLCTRNHEMIDASLAQLVEHDTLNVGVQGSSPWGGTKAEDENLPLFFCLPGSCAGACSDDAAFRGALVRRSERCSEAVR